MIFPLCAVLVCLIYKIRVGSKNYLKIASATEALHAKVFAWTNLFGNFEGLSVIVFGSQQEDHQLKRWQVIGHELEYLKKTSFFGCRNETKGFRLNGKST
jgi:hypothetical protein